MPLHNSQRRPNIPLPHKLGAVNGMSQFEHLRRKAGCELDWRILWQLQVGDVLVNQRTGKREVLIDIDFGKRNGHYYEYHPVLTIWYPDGSIKSHQYDRGKVNLFLVMREE